MEKKLLLLLLSAAMLLFSGCRTVRDMEVRRASDLSGSTPLTNEAEPSEIALGIYLNGESFSIVDVMMDERRSGVQWLCCSESRAPIIALRAEKPKGTAEPAPYFVERLANGPVNTHRDFIVGMLAAGGVDKNQKFLTPDGGAVTLGQFVKIAIYTLPPMEYFKKPKLETGPDGNELGWTLLATAHLADLRDPWITLRGEKLTAADLLGAAISHDIPRGSCAGTHELIGIAALLAAYEADGVELKGEWKRAREYLDRAIETARENQLETGAFGPQWFENNIEPKNPIDAIYYTGHVLDWLVTALPEEELSEKWVRKSVSFLAGEMDLYMDQLMDYPEYAFHAAHALKTYLHRTSPSLRRSARWQSKSSLKRPCPFLFCQDS